MDTSLFVAVVLVVAGLLTLELRISSAIIELLAGILLSAFVDVRNLSWLEFLAYQFLREGGLLDGEAGQSTFAAAMAVDVLSMVALAILMGRLGWATVMFLLVIVPVLAGLPELGRWIFRRYENAAVEIELRFLLLVLVGLGSFAEHAGVHAAIVAFLVGLLLSEVVQDHEALEDKLKGVVFSFFAPVFFLHAGTRIDLASVDAATVGVTATLLAAAVAFKYAGTALAGRWLLPGGAHALGILFNYRLTFGIITATVGLEEGVLDPRLFTALLLVVLLSAALPMILLHDLPSELRT